MTQQPSGNRTGSGLRRPDPVSGWRGHTAGVPEATRSSGTGPQRPEQPELSVLPVLPMLPVLPVLPMLPAATGTRSRRYTIFT